MISVLVVDDSAVVRRALTDELQKAGDIHVVATAVDAFAARDKIVRLKPDVVTLDLDMPRMNGLTFLGKLMKYYPVPVIVVSALTPEGSDTAMRALELGAVDVVCKPNDSYSVDEIGTMFVDRIRAVAKARSFNLDMPEPDEPDPPASAGATDFGEGKILAIGASTGGTEAIKSILTDLPGDTPGTVIVQHIPAHFTATFAERLDGLCKMQVREAKDGDLIEPGVALIAPGNYHMTLRRQGKGYRVAVASGPRVFHQRPSVDVLFQSVARLLGPEAVGVLLTGMGADGARGMLAMREAGAVTFAQDESSCVVFGMPREAIRLGAAQKVVPLKRMPREILRGLQGRSAKRRSA